MQKFCKFVHLKLTFSILHSHFYKTPTSFCLLYTFIQIKYSKPSHYKPNQYPTIINPINTHGSIPIKTHSSKSSTVSPPNLTRLPHIKLSKNLKLLPLFLLSLLSDPQIMFLRAPPRHRFQVSCIVVCLLISTRLLLCGLLVDLNKPPPFLSYFQFCCSRKF